MSVRIRLTRAGRKKVPHYRIVVMDSRNRRDGAYLEQLGVYHPNQQPAQFEVNEDEGIALAVAGSDSLRDGAESAFAARHHAALRPDEAPDAARKD